MTKYEQALAGRPHTLRDIDTLKQAERDGYQAFMRDIDATCPYAQDDIRRDFWAEGYWLAAYRHTY